MLQGDLSCSVVSVVRGDQEKRNLQWNKTILLTFYINHLIRMDWLHLLVTQARGLGLRTYLDMLYIQICWALVNGQMVLSVNVCTASTLYKWSDVLGWRGSEDKVAPSISQQGSESCSQEVSSSLEHRPGTRSQEKASPLKTNLFLWTKFCSRSSFNNTGVGCLGE